MVCVLTASRMDVYGDTERRSVFFVCYLNYALIIAPGVCISFALSLPLSIHSVRYAAHRVADVLCFLFDRFFIFG